MTPEEMDEVLELLAQANPKTIFLELAFMESWVLAVNKRHDGQGIPGELLERALPFFEREFRWTPHPARHFVPRPGWSMRIASWAPLVLLGLAGLARGLTLA
jgi:hypothetical protein